MAHAYYIPGEGEQGIAAATAFAAHELGGAAEGNPDITILRYSLFSVEEARKLLDIACSAPVAGDRRFLIVSMTRFFHEAQNALLKLFEEPPRGVTLILAIPSEGMLLGTLRSRLVLLPSGGTQRTPSEIAQQFLKADTPERGKIIEKLLARTKSDKDEEKQQARSEAVRLVEELLRAAHATRREQKGSREQDELRRLEHDLLHFLPLLHTRSAPLKQILEHLTIVIPTSLTRTHV